MSDERKPFWARCANCRHAWIAAYVPMALATFAETIKHARCPACGSAKAFPAKQKDGALLEEVTP